MKTRNQTLSESSKRNRPVSPNVVMPPMKRRNAFRDLTNALRNVCISHASSGQSKVAYDDHHHEASPEIKKKSIDEDVVQDLYKTDYDRQQANNCFQLPVYAHDIFEYYRSREGLFKVDDYLKRQPSITANMRAILVDWMVEAQEGFPFNHETLYQAVKMTDLYLCKRSSTRKDLQLVATTAMLIASKFDERLPPTIDDFLYICDNAYTRKELLDREMEFLRLLNFDIGFPLSYTFLRRFAKACGMTMNVLTLARYVLEMSLMFYEFVGYLESEMAAASLLLAMEISKLEWTNGHVYYSGYTKEQLLPLMWKLNKIMDESIPGLPNSNIKAKYSSDVFFGVANMPPLKQVV